jgi:roadblock/LC7 domain-containing protein
MRCKSLLVLLAAGALVTGLASFTSPAVAVTPVGGTYVALAPARLLDTRDGTGTGTIAPVSAGGTVALQVTGQGNVPASGVAAVILNVTVTNPKSSGVITVYPDGTALPTASNLNFVRGQTVPNLVVVPVGTTGKVDLHANSGGTTDLVADVSGYFVAGASTSPGTFGSLTPTRLLDTRNGTGAPKQAVSAGGTLALQVTGRGGVPASGVSAVVMNVTVTQPTSSGVITAYADGPTVPTASNLNFVAGQTVPNLVVVPVAGNGKVDLHLTSSGTVQLVADVEGYFVAGAPAKPGAFTPLSPARLLDTRNGTGAPVGAVAPGGTLALQVGGRGGVPGTGASAVVLNVTVTQPTSAGVVTAYSSDLSSPPTASNLNFVRGQTVPNLVVVPIGSDGKVKLHVASAGTTHLVADVFGYFRGVGLVWSAPQSVDPLKGGLSSVSCLSPTNCYAGDSNGLALHYNGSTWATISNIDSTHGSIADITCPSPTFCAAADNAVEGVYQPLSFNGTKWTASPPVGSTPAGDISCLSSTFCILVDRAGNWQRGVGAAWSQPRNIDGSHALLSVTCISTSLCYAGDDNGGLLTFNGSTWSGPTPIDPGHALAGLKCVGASFCMAVDADGYYVQFDGSSWTTRTFFDTVGHVTNLACVSGPFCVAVDSSGKAVTFSGGLWGALQLISVPDAIVDVSCSSSTFCIAVTAAGGAVIFSGTPASWGSYHLVDPIVGQPTAVSCASTSFCAVVDASGGVMTYNGAAATAPIRVSPQISDLVAVSCPTTSFCAAVDAGGSAITYTGTWHAPVVVGANGDLVSVSCGSASFCVAVDAEGMAYRFDGSAWSSAGTADDHALLSVSCPSSTGCIALDSSGRVVTYSYTGTAPGTWSGPTGIGGGLNLRSISCTTTTSCVAVGTSSFAVQYNGTSGSFPAFTGGNLVSVSCASDTLCVGVGASTASSFDGSSWTPQSNVDLGGNLVSVSCVSTNCVAVDQQGQLIRSS